MMFENPEYRALLATVLAHPELDAPRLILADWIEEHGEPERAELIRIQCEIAAAPRTGEFRDVAVAKVPGELLARHDELVRMAAERDWSGVRHLGELTCVWRRGFVAEVRCQLHRWMGDHSCRMCDGQGRFGPRDTLGSCPACDGIGWSRPAGSQIVKRHPVEVAGSTEVVPHRCPGGLYRWTTANVSDEDWLPGDLFHLLDGWRQRLDRSVYYPSPSEAEAALSRALLEWARNPLGEEP